jgi:peptide methionine sulfoxide reductase msrA/msrB
MRFFIYLVLFGFGLNSHAQTNSQKMNTKDHYSRALFASGCYWGTEFYLQKAEGVISTTVGYAGGHVAHPSYREVCSGTTGHAETVEVVYDPEKISYEELVKLFFETHDPTQVDRQGPDIGTQYRSAIFYLNESQKDTAEKLKAVLESKGYDIATEITGGATFYPEKEEYHQDYYDKKGGTPYCHKYTERF